MDTELVYSMKSGTWRDRVLPADDSGMVFSRQSFEEMAGHSVLSACGEDPPLLRFRNKTLVFPLDLIRSGRTREDQQTVMERHGLFWFEREVQAFFAVAENLLPQRVGGEQTITAGMPVGRKACVLRMVEHGERYRFLVNPADQHGPPPARAPHGVACLSFTAAIQTADASII